MLYPLPKSEVQRLVPAFFKEEAARFFEEFLKKTEILSGQG
jgi:hypothetical protein